MNSKYMLKKCVMLQPVYKSQGKKLQCIYCTFLKVVMLTGVKKFKGQYFGAECQLQLAACTVNYSLNETQGSESKSLGSKCPLVFTLSMYRGSIHLQKKVKIIS